MCIVCERHCRGFVNLVTHGIYAKGKELRSKLRCGMRPERELPSRVSAGSGVKGVLLDFFLFLTKLCKINWTAQNNWKK